MVLIFLVAPSSDSQAVPPESSTSFQGTDHPPTSFATNEASASEPLKSHPEELPSSSELSDLSDLSEEDPAEKPLQKKTRTAPPRIPKTDPEADAVRHLRLKPGKLLEGGTLGQSFISLVLYLITHSLLLVWAKMGTLMLFTQSTGC